MHPPETRYANTPDGLNIAYQTLGDGPLDLIFVPQWFSHVEMIWTEPLLDRFLRQLATFARLIIFDQRGTGLSDPVSIAEMPPLDARMDDIIAVLDAAQSDRAAVMGASFGGPLAVLFAASHPTRTSSLILFNTYARMATAPDYEIGVPPELLDAAEKTVLEAWGTAATAGYATPDLSAATLEWLAKYQRSSISPGAAVALLRVTREVDVRAVLPTINVPALVLHRRDNPMFPPAHGRYLAEGIPDARFVEVPGSDNSWWADDQKSVLDEIQMFLTGTKPAPSSNRLLATVVFTDLVGSTEKAFDLGDESWVTVLRNHTATVQREVERFHGKYIKSTGDGALATFDGPARAVRCTVAIRDELRRLGLDVRAGVHTGEIELLDDDIAGIAVHIGSRVSAMAAPGEVLVSRTVTDLVAGSGLEFDERGEHELKGVPGKWAIYAVNAEFEQPPERANASSQ